MISRLLTAVVIILGLPAAGATISGTVKAASDGAPLALMTVDAYTTAGVVAASVTTNASGAYTLTIPGGSYRMLAWDPRGIYATSFHAAAESFDASTVVVIESSEQATVLFSMQRAGWITGTVRSTAGEPVAAATVAAYNASGTLRGRTVADASGAYRLTLPPGNYRLAAWDDLLEYLPRFHGALTFAEATPVAVIASVESSVHFTLPPVSSFSGVVVDQVTGLPVGGIVAAAWDSTGTLAAWTLTDASGSYRLVLESGSYRLVFSDPGGTYAATYYPNASALETSPLLTLAIGESRSAGATLLRGARIAGHVRDRVTGTVLPGITVAAWNEDGTRRTFERTGGGGEYVLVVPPGSYRIGAHDDSLVYAGQFHADTVLFSAATPISVFAGEERGVDLELTRAGRFTGRITSVASGAALSGATVAAYDSEGRLVATGRSRPDGTYALAVLPGQYHLAAWDSKDRFNIGHRDGSVSVVADAVIDFTLVPKSRNRSVRH